MRENQIPLCGNAHPAEFVRKIGKVRNFHARNIVEIVLFVAVAADAVVNVANLAGHIARIGIELLPLGRDRLAGLTIIAGTDASDEHCFALDGAGCFEIYNK